MFTGIVSGIGRLVRVLSSDSGASISVELSSSASDFNNFPISAGDSLSVSGVCLTVISVAGDTYEFYVSKETLSCTCGLDAPDALVNLEPAMRASSPVGGHFVSGHVDCVGEVVGWYPAGESQVMIVSVPISFAQYFTRKGSVAVDGVSLTINDVVDSVKDVRFSINLIPYTLSHTIACQLQLSSLVNVEIDMISRYVFRCAEVFLNNSRNNGA